MIYVRYILEVMAWNGSTEVPLYFTTGPALQTGPTDTPANTLIPAVISDAGLTKYTMYSGGKTSGASQYSSGMVTLTNEDQSLDYLKSYGFHGRRIRLYEGPPGGSFPTDFSLVYTQLIESPSFAWKQISFTIRSYQAALDVPVPTGTFDGTGVGLGGSDSLKGKQRPFLLGRALNIAPVECGPSGTPIYAVAPLTGVAYTEMGADLRVFDSGYELFCSAVYATESALLSVAPEPGTYGVWEAGGYIRLGSPAVGTVTCNVASRGRAVTARPATLIKDLLLLTNTAYDEASLTALQAAFRSEAGVYSAGAAALTITQALDSLCSACGAYWYFDAFGKVVVKQLVAPEELSPSYVLSTAKKVYSVAIAKTQDTVGGIPAHLVTLLRSRNYTVMTRSDVVDGLSDARKNWLKEEWRKTQVSIESVLTAYPTAKELIIETTLVKDDPVEAQRRSALYSVPRELITIEVDIDCFGSTSKLYPGLCIQLELEHVTAPGVLHRYGVINKKMVVVGFIINRVTDRSSITLWG